MEILHIFTSQWRYQFKSFINFEEIVFELIHDKTIEPRCT